MYVVKPDWVEHQIIPASKPPPAPDPTSQYCTLHTSSSVAEQPSPYFSPYSGLCNALALPIHHISSRFSFYISDHYRIHHCQSCPQ